ncbi:hypothetical protein PLESTF_000631500 [Pleodorina starrii]|nr:hypothetical protein PLESTF_000631500 [Pleodorina starrii]
MKKGCTKAKGRRRTTRRAARPPVSRGAPENRKACRPSLHDAHGGGPALRARRNLPAGPGTFPRRGETAQSGAAVRRERLQPMRRPPSPPSPRHRRPGRAPRAWEPQPAGPQPVVPLAPPLAGAAWPMGPSGTSRPGPSRPAAGGGGPTGRSWRPAGGPPSAAGPAAGRRPAPPGPAALPPGAGRHPSDVLQAVLDAMAAARPELYQAALRRWTEREALAAMRAAGLLPPLAQAPPAAPAPFARSWARSPPVGGQSLRRRRQTAAAGSCPAGRRRGLAPVVRGGMFAAKPRGPAEAEEEAYDTFLEEWPRLRAHERRDYDQSLPDMRAPFAELLLAETVGGLRAWKLAAAGRLPPGLAPPKPAGGAPDSTLANQGKPFAAAQQTILSFLEKGRGPKAPELGVVTRWTPEMGHPTVIDGLRIVVTQCGRKSRMCAKPIRPPTVDTFADEGTAKLPVFNTATWSPNAAAIDAFAQHRSGAEQLLCINPSSQLMGRG